jgi:hypothetical protein
MSALHDEPYDAEKAQRIEDESERSTWTPIDLRAALEGTDIPPPELLKRVDDKCLLYRRKTHWFQGESESLKSFGAQAGTAQVLTAGGTVTYIDFEDDEKGVTSRLRALGVPADVILARFTYLRPEEPLKDKHGRVTGAFGDICELAAMGADLAVVDGVTEAMVTEGLNILDNADVATWNRLVPRRFANAGSAAVCLDHLGRNTETRGRYAIGAQHKLAGVSGAVYGFELLKPLSRATFDPVEALVRITVQKDRPGHIRSMGGADKVISIMTATSWPDGGVSVAFGLPDSTPAPDLGMVRRILEYVRDYDGCSQRRIEENVAGGTDPIRAALRWLVAPERAWLRIESRGRSHLHYLTDEGREHLS